MTTKLALLGSGLILTVLGGATIFVVWSRAASSVPTLLPAVALTPDAAATIMISCDKGETFGSTIYPICSEYCSSRSGTLNQSSDLVCTLDPSCDSVAETAIFARCRPDEDLTYVVQPTREEILDSNRRPEIAFVLTDAGVAQNAVVTRSSGSKSLDLKVLSVVASRRYKATRCGPCRIFLAPPVNLKK